MRYQSNLTAPDLSAHFKLKQPPLQILGHDIPSDPDFEPNCGFWSHDEAAILYNCAKRIKLHRWMDIGARFGWTAAYVMAAAHSVAMVDPHLAVEERLLRLISNIRGSEGYWRAFAETAEVSMEHHLLNGFRFDGFVIDGNHDAPEPLKDAQGCARLAADAAVILLHDVFGQPIRMGVRWLLESGWKARMYWTPNGVAVCWRGEFTPPDHVRDPAIDWRNLERMVYADIARGEWS